MDEAAARAIGAWRYEGIYAVYNSQPDDVHAMLDPENSYYSATDRNGDVAGYCCFGPDARVPGGEYEGNDDSLDVGLGLRPDLTGRGRGREFLEASLDLARRRFSPSTFRLTVATFNRRALRLYERAGFKADHVFTAKTRAGETQFVQMTRTA